MEEDWSSTKWDFNLFIGHIYIFLSIAKGSYTMEVVHLELQGNNELKIKCGDDPEY